MELSFLGNHGLYLTLNMPFCSGSMGRREVVLLTCNSGFWNGIKHLFSYPHMLMHTMYDHQKSDLNSSSKFYVT